MNATAQMSCRELVELVTDYLEGTLAESDRARFEVHLELCEYCVTYVEQMRVVVRTLGKISEESISPQARDELLAAFSDFKRD